jgi:hypothetical protein
VDPVPYAPVGVEPGFDRAIGKKSWVARNQTPLDVLPELLHVLLGMVSSLFQGIQDGMEEAVHAIIDAFSFKRDKRMLSQFCIHELRFRQRVWALGAGSRTRGSSTHAHGDFWTLEFSLSGAASPSVRPHRHFAPPSFFFARSLINLHTVCVCIHGPKRRAEKDKNQEPVGQYNP